MPTHTVCIASLTLGRARAQEMLISIHSGPTQEALAHPVAFVLKKKRNRKAWQAQWGYPLPPSPPSRLLAAARC